MQPSSPHPARFTRSRRIKTMLLSGLALSSVALVALATVESPERYPYDPACAWGRLADGHGMLLRCIEPAEARALLQADDAAAARAAQSSAAPAVRPDQRAESRPAAPELAVETRRAEAPPGAPPVASTAAPAAPGAGRLSVTNLGPAQADTGELPLAASKLAAGNDRYIECATKHGGLSADRARVVLRFLVRERGRAEGVEVKSFNGMSKAAATCIAEVVDRRYVGYPAAPIVGATFPIELGVIR